jgi:hypothetical protein
VLGSNTHSISDDLIDIESSQLEFSFNQTSASLNVSYYCPEPLDIDGVQFDLEYANKVLDFVKEHPKYKFTSINHLFNRVRHPIYLDRYRKYVNNAGIRLKKLISIKDFVFEKFLKARECKLPVHDIDLKRWAVAKATELQFPEFLACDTWIYSFKSDFNIVSRKITKLVTTKDCQIDTYSQSQEFLKEARELLSRVPPSCVINTDQSGFYYEFYSKRTLSHSGEKSTSVVVSSMQSVSHSYTIQPVITLDGKLLPKFLTCLQEREDHFGPNVFRDLPDFKNVVIRCSKSGKMTKELIVDFNNVVIKPHFNQEFVYIADSWTGHSDGDMYKEIFGKQCIFLKIPPHCTSLVQPLDVFFFRFWKLIVKRMFNEVILHGSKINLKERNNTIMMHSLIHNQLSAPAFSPLISYAWFRAGYTSERIAFRSVLDICFPKQSIPCSQPNCKAHSFISCSWCTSFLCFNHFFVDYHNHL